jgi:hypothetical protein
MKQQRGNMDNNFKLLLHKEEEQLSPECREEYYHKIREYAKKRTLTNTTKGACTIGYKQLINSKEEGEIK